MSAPVKDGKMSRWMKDPALPIYISGFLDLFGVSMLLPLIQSHVRDLGASPTVAGILGSTYGALQLFSSPLVGQWSDLQGRRFTLLVCMFMISCGYAMFSLTTTIVLMFVARIPIGIFKHTQNIERAYLADITSDRDHSRVLGNFNAASSIGFIVGPAIGGHIAEMPGGFYIVAVLTAAIFFINFGLVWVFMPKSDSASKTPAMSGSSTKQQSDESSISLGKFFKSMMQVNWRDLWDLFLIRFLLGSSIIVFRSNFSLMLLQKYTTTPSMNGYIISFNSMVSAFVGFFTGTISSRYRSDATLLQHITIAEVVILLCLALSPTLWFFVACLIPLGFLTTVGRVTATSLTITRGGREEIGTLMGFSQSCMSIARILGPLVAGLVQEISPSGPGVVGAGFALIAVVIMVIRPQDPENRKKKTD